MRIAVSPLRLSHVHAPSIQVPTQQTKNVMDPARLPAELFGLIIRDAAVSSRDLCRFVLVSRHWHTALHGHIYSTWSYDGTKHSISSLWKFSRSALCNQRIAESVEELRIRNWRFGLVHKGGLLVLQDEDLDLIRGAIHTAGLGRIEGEIFEALKKADPRPLMALLLVTLRNLAKLDAHVAETDIFLAEVLRQAVGEAGSGDERPLRRLEEVTLASGWNYREYDTIGDIYNIGHCAYTLRLDGLWPLFRLPSISTLSLSDLVPDGAAERLGNSPRSSNITDLTLVFHVAYRLDPHDVRALLALPKRLTALSTYSRDDSSLPDAAGSKQTSNLDLWDMIRQHDQSLERLDLYRGTMWRSPQDRNPHHLHLGTLQGFKALQHLSVQTSTLLGCCRDHIAPFLLKDTLPHSLKSLTLYSEEEMQRRDIVSLLRDVFDDDSFPLLTRVALEEPFFAFKYSDKIRPHDEVKQLCEERGRKYETKKASYEAGRSPHATKGGLESQRYNDLVKIPRETTCYKMAAVRFALQRYLFWLRTTSKADGSDKEKTKFSVEDLDTFELPWVGLTHRAPFHTLRQHFPYLTDEYAEDKLFPNTPFKVVRKDPEDAYDSEPDFTMPTAWFRTVSDFESSDSDEDEDAEKED
ncbi:hypothetical protein OQA88_1874 [Cercophora sp. LCS_1]